MSEADIQAQRRKEVRDREVRFQPVILVVKEGNNMGGKPNKGTKKDKRIKGNK